MYLLLEFDSFHRLSFYGANYNVVRFSIVWVSGRIQIDNISLFFIKIKLTEFSFSNFHFENRALIILKWFLFIFFFFYFHKGANGLCFKCIHVPMNLQVILEKWMKSKVPSKTIQINKPSWLMTNAFNWFIYVYHLSRQIKTTSPSQAITH